MQDNRYCNRCHLLKVVACACPTVDDELRVVDEDYAQRNLDILGQLFHKEITDEEYRTLTENAAIAYQEVRKMVLRQYLTPVPTYNFAF